MLTPPLDDAPPRADGSSTATAAWVDAAWAHLTAKPEFSLRPQPWTLPLGDGRPPSGELPARILVLGMSSDYGNGLLLQLLRLGCVPVGLVTSTRLYSTNEGTLFAHAAAALDIPYRALPNVNAPAAVEALRDLEPDALFVFSFDQILKPAVLAVARHGAVNFHPSLLPRFRGPEPLFWQILLGEREAGLTAHLMTERIDAGPILGRVRVPVHPHDTAGTLARRIVLAAEPLLAGLVRAVVAGRLEGYPPDLAQGSYQRGLANLALDWRRPATELERLVRAGRPDTPPVLVWRSARYYVHAARVVPQSGAPGVVVAVTDEGPIIGTGDQALLLTEVTAASEDGHGPRALRLRPGDDLLGETSAKREPRL